MILSFHPCFVADKNIICAGRNPDINDLAAIEEADAVILPQGCSERLYTMAKNNCSNIFPDFDARFQYPGKLKQIELFQKTNTDHPLTLTFPTVSVFHNQFGLTMEGFDFNFPLVFKFDWGGEGDTVYFVSSGKELNQLIQKAMAFEKTGQAGFLIQEHIYTQNRSLRVNVVGQRTISFWRVLPNSDTFHTNLSKGAQIDYDTSPELQEIGKQAVSEFCKHSGINLAGFDLIFPLSADQTPQPHPLFLEINYFFGRRGLGGSEAFYAILVDEIRKWLNRLGLSLKSKERNETICL